jgi:hypothetical protein
MHLGIYRFAGDPGELLAAYDRLRASLPPDGFQWHLCAVESEGIAVYDTCPSEEVFRSFSTGPGFRAALAAAGLPEPSVSGYPVHAALPA